MNRDNRQLLIGILALGWLLTVFIGYIYIHKPFSPTELTGILLIVWRTFIALTIISVAGGIGLATKLCNLDAPALALAALNAALGLGIIGVGVLVVGVIIGVNFSMWALLLVAGVFLWKKVLLWWAYAADLGRLWKESGQFSRIILFLTAVILLCQYSVALAPPIQFDALTYHLAIPQAYIQMGRIAYLPENMFWGMPEQTEMLYMLAMWLGGVEAAPVLGWWIGVLALAGLVGFTEKTFSRDSAWVTVASLMCASALTISISSAYVEWAAILFGLAMSICLIQWAQNNDRSTLVLAGVFAGMALGTKYTAGIALLAGFVVVALFQKQHSSKRVIVDLILFGGVAAVTTLPWWTKNILATSNPFYPLLIPAGAMDASRLALYQLQPHTQDWSRLVLLPWQITIWGVDGGVGYSASIGPLLLGLSLLALINWRQRAPEQRLAMKISGAILLTGLLVWAIASQFTGHLIQTRLYYPIFPAWALLCGAGYLAVSQVKAQGIRFGNISAALVVMALGFNTFFMAVNVLKSGSFLAALNPDRRESYLQNNLGAYQPAMQALKELPGNARVVMLWETRGLACQPKCDSDEIIDRWSSDWAAYGDPAAIISAWKKQGYTHVLFYRFGADFVQENHKPDPGRAYWDGLNATLALLPKTKDIGGFYELYALP